ncbi:MAG: DUF502 domain-containing protein [Chloroflexota bacterium]
MDKKGVSWVRHLRSRFLMGLLVGVPIIVTILVLIWVFNTIDNILQPIITALWGHHIPGTGFVATVILIYLTGVIAENFVGKRLLRWGESLLARVPMVWQLYNGIKQILLSFSDPGKTGFMQVVLVEFPRKGMMALAFVTNVVYGPSGEKFLNIFVPTSPNPTSGFMQIMKEEEVIRTRISIDEALKMVVSAGRVVPEELGAKFPSKV